jgi:hypothetical protein
VLNIEKKGEKLTLLFDSDVNFSLDKEKYPGLEYKGDKAKSEWAVVYRADTQYYLPMSAFSTDTYNFEGMCVIPDTDNIQPYVIHSFSKIARRRQWLENFGYCGETSYIAAALYYGMYMSQWDVRRFINDDTTKQSDKASQLLLGPNQNEKTAADLFGFECENFTSKDENEIIQWFRSRSAIYPVITGVYENQGLLGNLQGDDNYDHIVLVINSDAESLRICDLGLVTQDSAEVIEKHVPFTFDLSFKRSDRTAALDSLSSYSLPSTVYATCITGIKSNVPLVRVQITLDDEAPLVDNEPQVTDIAGKVWLYGMEEDVSYDLFQYSKWEDVPLDDHRAQFDQTNGNDGRTKVQPMNTKQTSPLPIKLKSNTPCLFRCVRADKTKHEGTEES